MALWDRRKVVVCLGTGGVGKTTVSAAMAVAAAAAGRNTLVMTVDPARRLAQALGLTNVGNTAHPIDPELFRAHGVHLRGSLHVMMPDVKTTFDALIERWAPDAARAEKILNNTIYQHFSTALAGSHEYAAVEKLYEVVHGGAYDLIVLDTPPSQNAVDFLAAPGRVLDFLDNESIGWLSKPSLLAGRMSLKLLDMGSSLLIKTLGRLAGADTLRELSQFVLGFQGMYEGFRERSAGVKSLLSSQDVAFTLVCAPQHNQQQAMQRFRRELEQAGLKVSQVVVNRVRPPVVAEADTPKLRARLSALLAHLPSEAQAQVQEAVQQECTLAFRDAAMVQALRLGDLPVLALPELRHDVRDLASLAVLHQAFLAAG